VPDLSVIIVTWNVCELVQGCVRALFSPEVAQDLTLEVIVVDSASADGTSEWAASHPRIKLLALRKNVGFGRANNVGARHARGRHLLLLNPDTIPQPGCLTPLVEFAKGRPEVGIISPRLLNADGTVQRAAFRFPTLLMHAIDLFPLPRIVPGRIREALRTSSLNGRYPQELSASEPFRIDHPLGACMLVSRTEFERLGGFDERIFMYSEEIDLALRYRASGFRSWQVPMSQVVHLGGQSTGKAPARMKLALWRSRLYLYRKHYSVPAQLALRFLLLVGQFVALLRLAPALVLGRVDPPEWRREWSVALRIARMAVSL
jgi:N-acetylglucosaminyl-diphospho-decaprenol L-rhamnosyltransferase